MKIQSIKVAISSTVSVSALLVDHQTGPVTPLGPVPQGWGVVLFGRSRSGAIVVSLNSFPAWLAEYSPKEGKAIVYWSSIPWIRVDDRLDITSQLPTEANCPECGHHYFTSSGKNWLCAKCGHQWRKNKTRKTNHD